MKKSIVFFSIEAGLAHVTRSLAIAEELAHRGHRVVFPIHPSKNEFIKKVGIDTMPLSLSIDESKLLDSIERWKDPSFIFELAREQREIVDSVKADVIVADFMPSAVAVGVAGGIPIAFLTGSGGLPYGCHLPDPGLPKVVRPLVEKLVRFALLRTKRPFYSAMHEAAVRMGFGGNQADLFSRLTYIVPEYEGYLPVPPAESRGLRMCHVGPLSWKGFGAESPDWLSSIHRNGRTVYITFGGTGYDGGKLVQLARNFSENGWRVIVSSSSIAPVDQFPKNKNIFVSKYLPGDEVCKRVDLVVCHGGYGTMTGAALAGTPIVSVPFNPDQMLHSLRFSELGLGRSLLGFDLSMLLSIDWRVFEQMGKGVSVERIRGAAESVMKEKKKFERAIHAFGQRVGRDHAPERAADIIENLTMET